MPLDSLIIQVVTSVMLGFPKINFGAYVPNQYTCPESLFHTSVTMTLSWKHDLESSPQNCRLGRVHAEPSVVHSLIHHPSSTCSSIFTPIFNVLVQHAQTTITCSSRKFWSMWNCPCHCDLLTDHPIFFCNSRKFCQCCRTCSLLFNIWVAFASPQR